MDELWALPAESAHTWLYPLRARLLSPAASSLPSVSAEEATPPYQRCDGMAVISVTGVITRRCERGFFGERLTQGQDELLRAVTAAQADPDVRALFFRINSPGGVVAGTKELADSIAAGPKPAGAYADGLATSAAFWLASATGRIYAPATAMLGSVGVISEVVSLSGFLKRQGIDVQLLAAGKWKTAGHRAEPLDDERRAYLQQHVDAMHAIFRDDVARHLGIEQNPAWTDAQILLAPAARELGLIRAVVRDFGHALQLFQEEIMKGIPSTVGTAGSASAPVGAQLTREGLAATAPDLLRTLLDEGRAQGRHEARQDMGTARADGVEAALAAMSVCCDAATVARVREFIDKAESLGLSNEQLRGLSGLLPAASSPDDTRNSRRDILAALQQGQAAPLPTGGAPARQHSSLVADAERLAAGLEGVNA
ncbi:S49 family peptidase [uncultured Desulfovibrio sp.]|uniref:S49 family peptidase n=1 Tax=uncultured Desulfovibrio sp. TaxID=167968 RepID=UPI002626324B|nr:S49 family peptidase [uncultured Desulfovibrio sp.]